MSVKITCKGKAKYVLNVELANPVLVSHRASLCRLLFKMCDTSLFSGL